jgi:uncharacterized protein
MKIKLIAVLFLIAVFSFSAFGLDRIVDNAGLLSDSERAELAAMIDAVSNAWQFGLVIVTERSIGGASPMDYADDFFDYNGYGFGENFDGCLFLQVTGDRDYWFSSTGRGNKILLSYAGVKLEQDVVKHLREDRYFEAYQAYILNWEEFLMLESVGRNYNFVYRWNGLITFIAWLLSFGIAFLVILSWKGSMNTALAKTQAASYMVPGSLSFKVQKDSFLYSTVTKTKKQTSSGSGGGGSIHTGSSGRSHGGRGRKY